MSATRSDATTPVVQSAATHGCDAEVMHHGCYVKCGKPARHPGLIVPPTYMINLGLATIQRAFFCAAHNPDRKPLKPRGPSAQVRRNRAAFAADLARRNQA